jgi:cell wall-associated NlpC family hydrolase
MVDYQSLIGRQWEYGKFDCFTLIRDWFKLRGIELPDFARPSDLETCESIFLKHAVSIGFRPVLFAERRPGDVLIMCLGTASPMHAAIFLADDRILHQRQDSLSAVEPLGRYYVSRVQAVFRYAADRKTAG